MVNSGIVADATTVACDVVKNDRTFEASSDGRWENSSLKFDQKSRQDFADHQRWTAEKH